MSKRMSKRLFRAEGIPTPAGVVLEDRSDRDAFLAAWRAGKAAASVPCVVKPDEQGSTIGISIVREPEQMAAALELAFKYDRTVLIEQFIEGIEITGALRGNRDPQVRPLGEIVPKGGFYDYERKYTPGATDEIVPARIPEPQAEAARELAVRCHRTFGCRGMSRVDMIVAPDGVWVLEVNTIPGMTPTSLLPRAAAAAGISFAQLVERLIGLAVEESDVGRWALGVGDKPTVAGTPDPQRPTPNAHRLTPNAPIPGGR
jgi:D-alanine-D-alanine ligase